MPAMFPALTAAMDFYADSSLASKVPRMISIVFKQRFHSACKSYKPWIWSVDLVQRIPKESGSSHGGCKQ